MGLNFENMGEVVAETQNQTAVVVDSNNTPIKDKKKNRRSRRSKQISPPTGT